MDGAGSGAGSAAADQPSLPVVSQPIIHHTDGGYNVRCPYCSARLFSSDIATWRAVWPDDPAPKLAIKCVNRSDGVKCARVLCLTWTES